MTVRYKTLGIIVSNIFFQDHCTYQDFFSDYQDRFYILPHTKGLKFYCKIHKNINYMLNVYSFKNGLREKTIIIFKIKNYVDNR